MKAEPSIKVKVGVESANDSDLTLMMKLFDEALKYFVEEGKHIEGVYDLLVRGGASKEAHSFVANWSDLDLSIILEKVDAKILKRVRELYQNIKEFFPYKLSVTIVSKEDFANSYHHHGIKPIYYSQQLQSSISLLRGKVTPPKELSLKILQLDCLANVSYLIHDLRSGFLKLEDSLDHYQNFFCHLLKRAKQLVRNSIFVLTGEIAEEIDPLLFKKTFPDINPEFPKMLREYKMNFNQFDSIALIEKNMSIIFNVLEEVHHITVSGGIGEENKPA